LVFLTAAVIGNILRALRRVERHPADPGEEHLGPEMLMLLPDDVDLVFQIAGEEAGGQSRRNARITAQHRHRRAKGITVTLLRLEEEVADRILRARDGRSLQIVLA